MGGTNNSPETPPASGGGGGGFGDDATSGFDGNSRAGAGFNATDPMLGDLTRDDFGLSASVGTSAPNRADDVYRVESVLGKAGMLGRAPGRAFKPDTAVAIGRAQDALNTRLGGKRGFAPLKRDGLVNPNGPTHTATRRLTYYWHGP